MAADLRYTYLVSDCPIKGRKEVISSYRDLLTLILFCLQFRQALVILASERLLSFGLSLVEAWCSEAGRRRRYG